ncbi:hypothetical protein TVAG_171240 [Trichomonas vaginalis G3]|uniref:Uncharacterized protein n=1 Tax=Trichomonas vaginalis (strain ATCC PRA-98 / G3) TaxID=412133 RepID=A2FYX4_TRIV3|nr:hypothetical protein TVAGG3_0240430 [Trichomonas vaginalis G3]EAX89895.1 hypothetical protein TVAG_171240 [Trichomonas vaginalis G3]KAI5553289.1 hypothetical protein TVAGG3_0240430 [Trichomonas vaginalis G3]|eukprot:XP_001302825.1 hypothetical protein [Trichomonas vaginalis G3]
MITIADCTTKPPVLDMVWIDGGQTSISYYNTSNNYVSLSPAFYLENSVGRANTSYINAISGTAVEKDIIFSNSDCLLQYANFYKNEVHGANQCFIIFGESRDAICSADHCVFLDNTASIFINREYPFTHCSFVRNSFGSTPPSVPYSGTNKFVVITQCHIGNHEDCPKQFSVFVDILH